MLSRHSLYGGRRRRCRRRGEARGAFVDVHGHWLFLVVTAIVALNFLDAWFTVLFLSYGGEEVNPVIAWVLQFGTWPFLAAKSAGIGLCVGFLTLTKNFRVARFGLAAVLAGYFVLLGWHFHLLQHLPNG
jgi:hypothetical protein